MGRSMLWPQPAARSPQRTQASSIKVTAKMAELPLTALKTILDYSSVRDILSFADVCHRWRSFVVSSSHIWRSISIDESSPFGDEFKQFNYWYHGFPGYEANKDKERNIMDKFMLSLANVTDLIENLKINIVSDGFSPESIHKLLMRQKRIVSLTLDIPLSDCVADNVEDLELSKVFLDVIDKHQSTLECLDVSNTGISFRNLAEHLCQSSAEFPKLKSIGYPLSYTYNFDYDFDVIPCYIDCKAAYNFQEAEERDAPKEKSAILQCFYQTLKHWNVEEINMGVTDFQEFRWGSVLCSSLESAIENGLVPKLKRLFIESINTHNATSLNLLTENCPQLTHLHCYRGANNKPSLSQKGTIFTQLVAHYNKNLLSLSCDIDDRLARVISDHCENLSSLMISDHYGNLEDSPTQTLSDNGLLALSKLTGLQNLSLTIDRKEYKATVNGLIKFLSASVANVRELTLKLPCVFYNEESLYEVLSTSCISLDKLEFTFSFCDSGSSVLLDAHIFLTGTQKIIKNDHPMKHFGVHHGEWFDLVEKPNRVIMTALIHSIVSFQSSLKTLFFFTKIKFSKEDRQFIIEALPYCQICFTPV